MRAGLSELEGLVSDVRHRAPFSIYVPHLQVTYENGARINNTGMLDGNFFD